MTVVAEQYGHVMGVDTHARTHTYAIVDTSTGCLYGNRIVPHHGSCHPPGHRLDEAEHERQRARRH